MLYSSRSTKVPPILLILFAYKPWTYPRVHDRHQAERVKTPGPPRHEKRLNRSVTEKQSNIYPRQTYFETLQPNPCETATVSKYQIFPLTWACALFADYNKVRHTRCARIGREQTTSAWQNPPVRGCQSRRQGGGMQTRLTTAMNRSGDATMFIELKQMRLRLPANTKDYWSTFGAYEDGSRSKPNRHQLAALVEKTTRTHIPQSRVTSPPLKI